MHITKRDGIPVWKAWTIRLIAVLLSLVVAGVVIILIGLMRGQSLNPIEVFASMADGAFGTSSTPDIAKQNTWNMVRDTMILTCIAIGLAPAFKMRFWNIGAEGQMLVGAVITAYWMKFHAGLPNPLLFIVMILSALLIGAIWGFIPAFFKAFFNTNETLFTLMMNYIAMQITSIYVIKWEWKPNTSTVGVINGPRAAEVIRNKGWLGNMFSSGYNQDYGWLTLIVLLLAVGMFLYLRYTKHGYEIAVVGESENTARYSGIRVPRVYMRTMALSGALCGFAGFLAVTAISHTISLETAGGRGFTAIIVAWLAKMNPFVMILIAALLTFMSLGSVQIATQFGLNDFVSQIISGIILFFILGSEFFLNYKISFGRKTKEV